MPRMSGTTTVAANSSSGNVLAGQLHEIASRTSAVRFLAAAAATGLVATASIGGEIVTQEALVSHANRHPVLPDDQVAEYGAYPSDRIFLTFRNTTGAGIAVFWAVDVEILG
jgi:hypothetical protein